MVRMVTDRVLFPGRPIPLRLRSLKKFEKCAG